MDKLFKKLDEEIDDESVVDSQPGSIDEASIEADVQESSPKLNHLKSIMKKTRDQDN